jgi:hypothetical protein
MFENFLGKSPADILAEETEAAKKALADLTEKIAEASKQAPPPSSSGPDGEFIPGVEYRIHFKNGNSGEYSGAALVHSFPFDRAEVVSIEAIG